MLMIPSNSIHLRLWLAVVGLWLCMNGVAVTAKAGTLFTWEAPIQGKGPKRPDDKPSGPKRPVEEPEIVLAPGSAGTLKPANTNAKKNALPKSPPKMGALVVNAVIQAQVTLTESDQRGATQGPSLVQGGLYFFRSLKPGSRYALEITHPDYLPLRATIKVKQGQTSLLNSELVERYGTVIVDAIGMQADRLPDSFELTLALATGEVRKDWKNAGGQYVFTRVPVGRARLALRRVGYQKWEKEIEVKPGKSSDNKFAANLERLLATVSIETEAEADVYWDADAVRHVSANRRLLLEGLAPGDHTLVVMKPGRVKETLPLTLNAGENPPIKVALLPITEQTAIEVAQPPNAKEWAPAVPAEWTFSTVRPMGLLVKGDTPVLVYKTTERNRAFNQYGDFDLTLRMKFANGKGAAWIVRAQDLDNYYLFEVTTAASANGLKRLVFYVCEKGVLKEVLKHPLEVNLEDPNRSYTIKLHAVGGRFEHSVVTESGAVRELCAPITDKTFAFGGIGLRAVNGLEMSIEQLTIEPLNP